MDGCVGARSAENTGSGLLHRTSERTAALRNIPTSGLVIPVSLDYIHSSRAQHRLLRPTFESCTYLSVYVYTQVNQSECNFSTFENVPYHDMTRFNVTMLHF